VQLAALHRAGHQPGQHLNNQIIHGPLPGGVTQGRSLFRPTRQTEHHGRNTRSACTNTIRADGVLNYAELDPEHFQLPRGEAMAEDWDDYLGQSSNDLQLVAEIDGRVVGWLRAHVEPPAENAAIQVIREPGWTRLLVDALVVDRGHWRHGAGSALLEAAESWGRGHGAHVARLDTYADSPVSVPFYEQRMGYRRRSIVFQKRL
jgi:GNAT superfamily N-acetyltransferase